MIHHTPNFKSPFVSPVGAGVVNNILGVSNGKDRQDAVKYGLFQFAVVGEYRLFIPCNLTTGIPDGHTFQTGDWVRIYTASNQYEFECTRLEITGQIRIFIGSNTFTDPISVERMINPPNVDLVEWSDGDAVQWSDGTLVEW